VARETRKKPINHTRKVLTGIVGSSMFDTAARTSAKGLSSSAYSNRESTSYLHCVSHTGARKNKFRAHLILFSLLSYPERSPLELAEGTSSDTITGRVIDGVSSTGTKKLNTSESLVRAVSPLPPSNRSAAGGGSGLSPGLSVWATTRESAVLWPGISEPVSRRRASWPKDRRTRRRFESVVGNLKVAGRGSSSTGG